MRNALAYENIVRTIACARWRRCRFIDLNDLIAAGFLGLLEAIASHQEKSDADVDTFESYARMRINFSITDWLRSSSQGAVRTSSGRRYVDVVGLDYADGTPRPLAALGSSPEESVAEAELRSRVWDAVSALNPTQVEAIIGHYVQDRTHKAIGEDLGVTEGAVAQRIKTATAALRVELTADEFNNPKLNLARRMGVPRSVLQRRAMRAAEGKS